ncbi:DUF805 domain-containing protein [Candidatus Pelagibacter ubique]|nr:DUF805 domain-containing protein [Candidatus Pelagibacter ubique]|tara:strand:+ start:111 stop:482 length:372 start_codon:yes stop_codon:yes gene_type:complete
MDFQTSIKTCFNKYAIFSGRASRSEFWFFVLFGLLGGIIAAIIDTMILGYSAEVNGPINLIFSVALILPSISVAARRLHDLDKSGWWQLLWFTIIGGILIIIWHATEGENKKNKFGPPIKIKK